MAGKEIWEVMTKQVKRSLEANYAAYEALRNGLKPGISEKDAYELVRDAVDRVCGTESHEFIGDFVGGVRTGAIEGPATDLMLKKGDLFICDLSVRRGEVWSDTCRTFFLGEPTPEQQSAYAAALEVQLLGERIVRPGVVCEDVKFAAEKLLAERGLEGRMPHHVGHLVGPKPYMKPAFEAGDRTILQEGVVCTLEPGIYFEGAWGLRVENDYAVTAAGLENLFDYPREMEYFIL